MVLGPAFVAGIAYVDPGNVATNTTAGSRYGYLLVWVVVVANAMAVLVQYLSAKVGIATGESLPQLCRRRYSRRTSIGLWIPAEAVAVATDLAEVLGGAIALQLLFGLPLLTGGVITGVVSFVLLTLQAPSTQHVFQRTILLMMGVIAVGFFWSAAGAGPDVGQTIGGLVPRLAGPDSLLLAAGMLGATVMPHAIYLHSALIRDRFGATDLADRRARSSLLRSTRVDVIVAMTVAGAVNLSMVLLATGQMQDMAVDGIEGVHEALAELYGPATALLFALALLASGFASSAVGTYAGAVILEGFMARRVAVGLRRLVTLVPALAVLAIGVEPTEALVLSQVVLSFGIPFALFPLVSLTSDADLMGELVNRRRTTVAGFGIAVAVSTLNFVLIVLTVT